MAELLDSNQVLLLNNLMYLNPSEGPYTSITDCRGMTVEQYVDAQLASLDKAEETMKNTPFGKILDFGLSEQQQRYRSILQAVRNDPQLSSMKIAACKTESSDNGGGSSAMFVNQDSKEAVVAYRGTALEEWKDNFLGGTATDRPDGVSTKYQEVALKTYQEYRDQVGDGYTMTVTGHSKGGNKAKYITLLDDSVDRCLSYDGQGFSDEFMGKYKDQIIRNQSKIANHNVNDDFVNLLLNDVGSTTFYKNNKSQGDLASNHYPDAYFRFGKDGKYEVNETERSPETAELDAFLNSALRSMTPENRKKTMALFGDMISYAFHQNSQNKKIDVNELKKILFSNGNLDSTAYFLAYLMKYEKEHPEFGKALSSYLERNGLGEIAEKIDTVGDLMQKDWFLWILDHVDAVGVGATAFWALLPGWVRKVALLALRLMTGLKLSELDAAQLLLTLARAGYYYNGIDRIPDGSDISYASSQERLFVDFDFLEEAAQVLRTLAEELESLTGQCRSAAADSAMQDIRFPITAVFRFFIQSIMGGSSRLSAEGVLNRIGSSLDGCAQYAGALGKAVQAASERFRETEKGLASGLDF